MVHNVIQATLPYPLLHAYDSFPMFEHHRHRRTFGAMPSASKRGGSLRTLLLLVVVACVVVWGGWRLLQALGFANQVQRMRVEFTVKAGPVNVSIEGGEMRRVDDAKLYSEDRVSSNTGGKALLSFFDGTEVQVDESTDVTIAQSERGTKSSTIALTLERGKVWVQTPSLQSFSGSIERVITTAHMKVAIPANTKAIVGDSSIQVYKADGLGVVLTVAGNKEPAYVGEGQQLILPADGRVTGSLYSYRSALGAGGAVFADLGSGSSGTTTGSGSVTSTTNTDVLTLTRPTEGEEIHTPTVHIEGAVGQSVERVRINGYDSKIDAISRTYAQELSLSGAPTMDILVEALDQNGVVIAQQHRTVRSGGSGATLAAPTITTPAPQGSVYRTNRKKFTISGSAPTGAEGIVVNDYRLQLFKAGDTTWSYLVNADQGNIVPGSNVFKVTAVDALGAASPAASITILLEDGVEGIVTAGSASQGATASVAPEQVDEKTLPQNAPLTPGILSVTGPTPGTSHTATGSEILIEGKTSLQTDSIWINGYRLRLFKQGKTFWNYIASTTYGTLKTGTNVYHIHARNAKNELLDSIDYTVSY